MLSLTGYFLRNEDVNSLVLARSFSVPPTNERWKVDDAARNIRQTIAL
jgi:hypothetical protein